MSDQMNKSKINPKDILFEPLRFRNLTVKNRLMRSNISGRIDNYNGSGSEARICWEEKFARGGAGVLISSHVPINVRGRILPNYAMIDTDERIPFWRELGKRIHQYDCKYILQISHSGRQQDMGGIENQGKIALSSTSKSDSFHGFRCKAMSRKEIREVIKQFAQAARRVKAAGLDGIELHSANGYLFTQFLSSAINDRKDEYGGNLKNRARFLLEVVAAVRKEVGNNFHLQAKISAVDYSNDLFFWEKKGTTLEESIQVCKWLEQSGVDALHISTGNSFGHPKNPGGDFPMYEAANNYGVMLPSGIHTSRNMHFFRNPWLQPLFKFLWSRNKPQPIEGFILPHAKAIKKQVHIPVICTGGFQTASVIRKAIEDGSCDAVSMARTLLANPDLPNMFKRGNNKAPKPCTYCNKCLINVLQHPLGCYDVSRFNGDEKKMMKEVMAFYDEAEKRSFK